MISVHRIADRWIFWGLLALLFWAPLPLGSNRTFAIAILVLWSQCLLWGALWCWRRQGEALTARLWLFRWPLGLLSAFVLIPWLQLVPMPASVLAVLSPEALAVSDGVVSVLRLTLDPNQTFIYAILSFTYWSCFVVALLVVRDAVRLERLALLLVASGLFQAVLGAVLFSVGARYNLAFTEITHSNVIGTFVNRNHMAGYMEICLSVGIGLMLAKLGDEVSHHRSWRSALAAAMDFMLSPQMRLRLMLVVMVIALVLTRSRMGNTAFFASMLIVGLLAIVLYRKTAPKTMVLIASLVVIDILVIGTWVGLEKVVERVQGTELTISASGDEESVEQRQDPARHTLALISDFPLFGTGAGTFYNAYMRYRAPGEGYFDHAHNDFAEIAADFGLPGLGILAAFVLLTAGVALSSMARRRSSLPRGMAFGALMAMLAIGIHSSVDFNLQIPANALTVLLVMALAWCAWALPRGVGMLGK